MMSFQNKAAEREGADRAIGTLEAGAGALALLWLIAVAGLVFRGGLSGEGGGFFAALAGVMAVVMPVAVIVMVAATARQIRALRQEAEALRSEILRLQAGGLQTSGLRAEPEPRRAPAPEAPPAFAETPQDDPAPELPEPPRRPEPRVTPPQTRPAPLQEPVAEPEPQGDPLAIEDYITALNFPDSPDDAEGIRALHTALAHEPTAKLIRAAQDVLTLMANDGVFMDDLPVDPSSPAAWRRLARDGRGAALGPMGALVSPQVFEHVAARMSGDQVFHDAAHHFLRQFDRSLAALAEVGDDHDLAALGETRTARAFLLLGRVAGSLG